MNTIGHNLRLTSYGESHGESIGAVLDGFPSGFQPDLNWIRYQMDRRRPGYSALSSKRKEEDDFRITSGMFEERTTGTPINFVIANKDSRSVDYDHLKEVYRPSHADFTYEKKYGHRDHRGGGRSSARVTAAWVAAGAMAQDYLNRKGIEIIAFVKQIGEVSLTTDQGDWSRSAVDESVVRCPDPSKSAEMEALIAAAIEDRDSLGGQITCVVRGLDAGIGDPVFGKLNAKLAQAMFSINAVKGFEVGGGFAMSARKGSEVNDAFVAKDGAMRTKTNHSGGIQGGISNGMDVLFNVAFKPTASIGKPQDTVDRSGEEVLLQTQGRHDPCVLPRAVPIVEAMTALVLLDSML